MLSSQFKFFAAGLLTFGAIATFADTAQAQSNFQGLGIFTESNFDAPPDENNDSLQGGAGGATRGNQNFKKTDSCSYAAIFPERGFSSTASSHPTFWLYVVPRETGEEVFVQADLVMHSDADESTNPIPSPSLSAPVEIEENDSIFIDFVHQLEDFSSFPRATVQDKLSEGRLISLTMPKHDPVLSDQNSYTAEISVACAASEGLLADKVQNNQLNLTDTLLLSVARDASITTALDKDDFSEQRSWLDTVDAIAQLSLETDVPSDATTAALLSNWEALLKQTMSQM